MCLKIFQIVYQKISSIRFYFLRFIFTFEKTFNIIQRYTKINYQKICFSFFYSFI